MYLIRIYFNPLYINKIFFIFGKLIYFLQYSFKLGTRQTKVFTNLEMIFSELFQTIFELLNLKTFIIEII